MPPPLPLPPSPSPAGQGQSRTTRRIAYWMSDKKSQKVNWDEFERVCAKYGYELFKVSLSQPLVNQEPFTVFLHKLTDIIALAQTGDDASTKVLQSIETYLAAHREVIVIDPFDRVRQLLNRFDCYTIIHQTDLYRHGVFTPNFCTIAGGERPADIRRQLAAAAITYPFICKPPLGHGSKKAHEMMLVFNEASLAACPAPCVAQAFINHNAVLYKLFIIGAQYYYVRRPSLKNFYASDGEAIVFDSGNISKAGAQSRLNVLDPADVDVEPKPDAAVFQRIVHTLRRSFRMDLLGVDVVIENATGRYGIIDVNVWPGYDGCADFYELLLQCIDAKVAARVEKPCENHCSSENIANERLYLASATV